jgi:predicted RNase H-like nuclease (RuvC/YqgF family)
LVQNIVEMCQNNVEMGQDSVELVQDMVDMGQDNVEMDQDSVRKNIIVPDEKRRAIVEALVARSVRGKLKHGDTRQVFVHFLVQI